MILTKTFIENRWYARDAHGVFREYVPPDTEAISIDVQVSDWVANSGRSILHPGQLGMHTAWHGTDTDPYAVKCVTLGLTVLYDAALQNGDGNGKEITAR